MVNRALSRSVIVVMALAMLAILIPSTVYASAPTGNGNLSSQTTSGVFATALIDMNIRGGPGTAYEVLGKLHKGESVLLDGRHFGWFRFSYPNSTVKGWLSGTIIKITGDITSLPSVTWPPEGVAGVNAIMTGVGPSVPTVGQSNSGGTVAISIPPGSVIATALVNMNIRGGPGTKYDILGKLRAGESVILDGRSFGWFRFSYPNSNVKGWLSGTLIKVTGNIASLPSVTFPPQ